MLAVAKKCKHCGETIDVTLRAAEEARRAAEHAAHGPMVFMNSASSAAVEDSLAFTNSGPVERRQRWNPGVAAILSFLIPGTGQMYKGQVANGLAWFVMVLIGYVLFIIPGLVLHVCCVLGAASGEPWR